jgi:HAE1 family hydrophobic/amphiphilic exporter-1
LLKSNTCLNFKGTISINLRPDVPLGEAVAHIEQQALSLPATISTGFQGAAQVYQASPRAWRYC